MRNASKFVLVGALLGLGASQSNAQTTNVVQHLNIKLTGYYQAAATETSSAINRHAVKVSIVNKDVIKLVGLEMNISFSDKAELMLLSKVPVDLSPAVIVRDKVNGNTVDTDVSAHFSAQVL